jgi:hypothetical protein
MSMPAFTRSIRSSRARYWNGRRHCGVPRDASGRDLHVEQAGFVSPLNLSFFFARIGIRALRGSLQEARQLG